MSTLAFGCAQPQSVPLASTNTNTTSPTVTPVTTAPVETPKPVIKTPEQIAQEAAIAKAQEEARQKQVIEEQKKLEEQKKQEEEARRKAEEASRPKTEQEYKASTKPLNYPLVNKNPDAHKGEAISFKGRAFQVQTGNEGGVQYELFMMDTNLNGYDSNNVAVIYPATTEFTEKQTLRVWGEIVGSYNYVSQAGYNLSIPLIRAGYIHP